MMPINRPSVSVVVPVYNGAATLPELVSRVRTALAPVVLSVELILVNDGSKDNSWQVIESLARNEPAVLGLNLMHNYGQHNALLAGIMRASHPILVTIDDDLQHPPEEIPKLLASVGEGYDVVYGKPAKREHTAWRNLSSKIIKVSLRMALGADMAEKSSAFRAFRAELKRGFARFSDAQVSIDVLLSWTADRVACVDVDHHPRKQGRSGYSLRKLLGLTMSMVTGYSTLPLRLASGLGLLSAGFGLALFMYVVIKRLLQEAYVPGFTFIAAAIALFAGLQLFTMGVIGEYLARVHFRTMGKPAYVIREQTKYDDVSQ
jgi:undecaprenyl-phosphate 4-deoxy-4-formamido-L-arabinose transferase